MLNFCVRKGSLTYRTPVDDSGTFVDKSFFVKTKEYFFDRIRASFIHGETFSVPVTGYTKLFQLTFDGSCVLFFPLPGSLKESFSSEFFLINSLCL